jgi:segregation and condensation protein B
MISPAPPPDELPENPDSLDEDLFSQDEIEEAYQRALAAFESAQAETETEEFVHPGADHEAGHEAEDLAAHAPPTVGELPPVSPNSTGVGLALSPDSVPDSYDEIPIDLTCWSEDEVGEPPAIPGPAPSTDPANSDPANSNLANFDPAEIHRLEEQAHAEFEALQTQLPPETQAVWQAETLETIENAPAATTPPAAPPELDRTGSNRPNSDRLAASSSPSRGAAAKPPQPIPADVNVTPSQVIEAALFVGGQPLTAGKLYALLRGAITVEQVPELIDELNTLYAAQERPYEIRLGDGGYRLELRPEYDRLRARVFGQGPREVRLSQDLLEVLALVAYRQPITQDEIEALGKASPGNQLRQLLRRELIQLERDPEQPKEVRYRTTERFLSVFGLANLSDLPQPDDLAAR